MNKQKEHVLKVIPIALEKPLAIVEKGLKNN